MARSEGGDGCSGRGTGSGKVPKVQEEDSVCEQVNPFPEKQWSAKMTVVR